MSRYKAYAELKSSGTEWLGKIPFSWGVKRLGQFFEERREKVSDEDYPALSVTMQGIVPQLETAAKTDAGDNRKLVLKNDFVINSRSDRKGSSGVSNFDGSVSLISIVMTPRGIHPPFAHHLLRSYPFQEEFYRFGKGIVADLWSTNASEMKNILIPDISLSEQEKIAAFLDHETAKIDALIEKQRRLIELLKEKRQAVISHAVTKGLNPNSPMKDSGVEWLGEVPAHWVSTRLKYLKGLEPNSFVDGPFGSNLKSEHFVEDGVIYVIESTFATTGILESSQLKKISLQHYETIKRSTTKGGDIIIAKIGARYGSSSILPELDANAVVSGNSLKLTVNESLLTNEYANELLRVLKANDAMDDGVNITAQPALSLGGLNNLPFLKIPLSEQNSIVEFVNEQKSKFDRLIFKSTLLIELSLERRTALISAAVTGKIDVRDWQAVAA